VAAPSAEETPGSDESGARGGCFFHYLRVSTPEEAVREAHVALEMVLRPHGRNWRGASQAPGAVQLQRTDPRAHAAHLAPEAGRQGADGGCSLLAEAKAVAAREGTTVRSLVEEGLRLVIARRGESEPFTLRSASFRGDGVRPDVSLEQWDQIRGLIYGGRGG
jgi:hypothetical protein